MQERRSFGYLILIVLIVVLPSAISLGGYHLSKNPSLRPLGITKQSLSAYNGGVGDGVEIVAVVDWVPPRTGNYTRGHLEQSLTQAFAAKGVEVRVQFRDGRSATRVTYRIGKTVLGPFSTDRASEGVAAAVEAYHMH